MKRFLLSLFCLSALMSGCTDTAPEIEKQIPEKLQTPTGLAIDEATVTSTSFVASWEGLASDDVEAYVLEYKPIDGTEYTEQNAYTNNCTVKGLQHSTTYVVRLRALSAHGEEYHSDYTSELEQATLIIYVVTPPENVRIVAAKTTSTSLLVEWDAVENVVGYQVSYTNKATGEVLTQQTAQTSITLRNLTAETEYDIAVQSLSRSGEEYNSQYSSVLVAKTKLLAGGIFSASDMVAFAAAVEAEVAQTGTSTGADWADADGVVHIKDNIDMTGVEWTPITTFNGTLDGNGFTISNLTIASYNENAGLFATLSDATIKNLNFANNCTVSVSYLSGASNLGGIAGKVTGSCTFENITTAATLSGGSNMGGIVGNATDKSGEVLFSGCTNNGSITVPQIQAVADMKVGGICGCNEDGVTYNNCKNTGAITNLSLGGNKYVQLGGIVGAASDAAITNCTNEGALKVDCRAANNIYFGGIVGRTFRGSAEKCVNNGTLTLTDASDCTRVYMAGCFGSVEGNKNLTPEGGFRYNYKECSNSAYIKSNCTTTNDVVLGGVIGLLYLPDINIDGCTNSGAVELTTTITNSCAGGILGIAAMKTEGVSTNGALLQNCTNTGAVTFTDERSNSAWQHIGGICGRSSHGYIVIQNCTNRGNITMDQTTRANAGGIISECKCDIIGCTNYGTVYATDSHIDYYSGLGGIVARMNVTGKMISGCTNYGTIIYNGKGFTKANANKGIVGQGGIVGIQYFSTVESCANYGTVLGNDYDASLGGQSYLNAKGAITGWGGNNEAVTIKDCIIGGAIGSCVDSDGDMGVAKATPITAENYSNYIYGGDAKNGVTASGCTFGQQ